jgi:UDP-2,3-diacylglucosamine pyrophosphatase LpxH
MLIITSDMHLTDHTVSPPLARKALKRFQEIVETAAKQGAVEVIFLGDTFDLLRSKRWLINEWTKDRGFQTTDVRPWSAMDEPPMDYVLTAIFADLKKYYGEFFKELRKPGNVRLTWVVGNHDRLAWCTKVGNEFLAQLGIEMLSDTELQRPEYGVLARHGHCYDEFNFYGDYDASPLGDAVVVEILDKLQVYVGKERQIVNLNHKDVAFLAGLEYVRPYSYVPITVREAVEAEANRIIANDIQKGWKDTVDEFFASKPYAAFVGKPWLAPFLNILANSISESHFLAKVAGYIQQWKAVGVDWSSCARREKALLDRRFKYVIYGHTHEFIEGQKIGNQQFYYNSGWWKRHFEGETRESKSFTDKFCLILVDKDRHPTVETFNVDSKVRWERPDRKGIDFAELFSEIELSGLPSKREGLMRMGIVETVHSNPAIVNISVPGGEPEKHKPHPYPKAHGFEVVIESQIGPVGTTTSGILIKDTVKGEDIDKAAQLVTTTSGVTNALFFTPGKVGASTKKKAALKNVVLLDATDIEKFKEPKAFGTALDFVLSKLKI